MDAQVLEAQKWLNDNYRTASGWVTVAEDGITGWGTIYALRRALQYELGVTPLSSGFGAATTAAFNQKVVRIDSSTTSKNLILILSAALWCKGYPGLWGATTVSYSGLSNSVTDVRTDMGLSSASSFVDVKLMESLLSMDAYVTLRGASENIREVQRWLNATYSSRRDFALVATDGIYSRTVQTALLFALQYELGMADGTANGNFGPGTRSGLQSQASSLTTGSQDTSKRFVRIFQASLRFNGLAAPFTGSFASTTASIVSDFQKFMQLPVNGRGDYATWCALLVSSGDTAQATKGFDTRWQLTAAEAAAAASAGYTVVGRYLLGAGKFITAGELTGLKSAGLKLLAIHQRLNNEASVMTYANGRLHALEALERGRALDLPNGGRMYFCVDFDALGETVEGPILDYFRGVSEGLRLAESRTFQAGVYGTRNVCSAVIEAGYATGAFVAGMSTGFSGNMGFPMPGAWDYNQILEMPANFSNSRNISIDKDVVSTRAVPMNLSGITVPPIERDGSTTATGFNALFEWVIRAEVAAETALSDAHTVEFPMKNYIWRIWDYITHYLRKEKYWGVNSYGRAFWLAYTPINDVNSTEAYARSLVEQALAKLSPTLPPTATDYAHFAATFRGYKSFGVPTSVDNYNYGDYGGWGLDLYQVFGAYLDAKAKNPSETISNYLTKDFNGDSSLSKLTFARGDQVADADGYLVAAAISGSDPQGLSKALRSVLQLSPSARLKKFYQVRFQSSSKNVVTAFQKLADGIDALGVNDGTGLSSAFFNEAANASRKPTPAEAEQCAATWASYLGSQA